MLYVLLNFLNILEYVYVGEGLIGSLRGFYLVRVLTYFSFLGYFMDKYKQYRDMLFSSS